MEKIRCGKTVFIREDAFSPWLSETFDSINLAKKRNGPDSKTVAKAGALPPQQERPEAQ